MLIVFKTSNEQRRAAFSPYYFSAPFMRFKMIQKTLLAFSDPTRREILRMLKKSARTVGEISERFDISIPAISRHLAVLKDAELVIAQREGKYIRYSLRNEKIEDMIELLKEYLR